MYNNPTQVIIARPALLPGLAAFLFACLTVGGLLGLPRSQAAQPETAEQDAPRADGAAQLDEQYQRLLEIVLPMQPASPLPWAELLERSRALAQDPLAHARLTRGQLAVMAEHLGQPGFWPLLERIYESNDAAMAQRLNTLIDERSQPALSSRRYWLLARFFESRGDWPAVHQALARVEERWLPQGDAAYLPLMQGYALARQKRHREAIPHYERIPPDARWYAEARLNLGLAYLRQGWWSEAHEQFEKALAAAGDTPLGERIRVTWGFSQLHFEFYRDARKTLRSLDLQSEYMRRGLLGIGLAAAHTEDFAGAVNAFERLSDATPGDEVADEALLLLPYALREMARPAQAVAAYERALQRYQSHLQDGTRLRKALETMDENQLLEHLQSRRPSGPAVRERPIPEWIVKNLRASRSLATRSSGADAALARDVWHAHREWLRRELSERLADRQNQLRVYLSQAQFGLAQLYDQN